MHLTAVSIQGYRSIRSLRMPVEACSVFLGGNGVGKTNLYRALQLLQHAAAGDITRMIAEEGGVNSVLWAGVRRKSEAARLILEAEFDFGALEYRVEIGLPRPTDAAFDLEPLVKEERLSARQGRRRVAMMERKGPMTTVRGEAGRREERFDAVLPSETALVALRDGARYPELEAVRQALLGWRLYHDFRTDPASPIRQPCQAIVTPTLAADGSDLAAVLATLALIRQDTVEIDEAIADAFPGAAIHAFDAGGSCRFEMKFPDMPRAFAAHELSDGTVKYLCLLGALLSYRMPSMVALNEPEASLHPSLLPPLARLIGKAVEQSRLWVVTHSDTLAEAIERETLAAPRRVEKVDGATRIAGLSSTGEWREERDDES